MQAFSQVIGSVFVAGILGAVSVAVLCTPLSAQVASQTRPVSLVVSGGAAVPVSGFRKYNELGVHADVSLLVRVASLALRLRPEFSYGRFALKTQTSAELLTAPASAAPHARFSPASATSADVLPGFSTGTRDASTLLGALGNVELPLAQGLYLLVGVGATNVKSGATVGSGDVTETGLTYNGGAGVRFRLGGISGFVEGRVKSISLEKGRSPFGDVRTIPVSFGLVF